LQIYDLQTIKKSYIRAPILSPSPCGEGFRVRF
jgi:hypothetical protein